MDRAPDYAVLLAFLPLLGAAMVLSYMAFALIAAVFLLAARRSVAALRRALGLRPRERLLAWHAGRHAWGAWLVAMAGEIMLMSSPRGIGVVGAIAGILWLIGVSADYAVRQWEGGPVDRPGERRTLLLAWVAFGLVFLLAFANRD